MNLIEQALAALETRLEAEFTSAGLTEPLLISLAGQPRLGGGQPSQAVRVGYQAETVTALAGVMPAIEAVLAADPTLGGTCASLALEPATSLPGVVATYVRIFLPA